MTLETDSQRRLAEETGVTETVADSIAEGLTSS